MATTSHTAWAGEQTRCLVQTYSWKHGDTADKSGVAERPSGMVFKMDATALSKMIENASGGIKSGTLIITGVDILQSYNDTAVPVGITLPFSGEGTYVQSDGKVFSNVILPGTTFVPSRLYRMPKHYFELLAAYPAIVDDNLSILQTKSSGNVTVSQTLANIMKAAMPCLDVKAVEYTQANFNVMAQEMRKIHKEFMSHVVFVEQPAIRGAVVALTTPKDAPSVSSVGFESWIDVIPASSSPAAGSDAGTSAATYTQPSLVTDDVTDFFLRRKNIVTVVVSVSFFWKVTDTLQ